MDGKERRLQPRVEVNWPVTMLTAEGTIPGETRDISMQGAFIYCEKPLPLSERFVLSVKAPAASMQVMAQVVWANNSGSAKQEPSGMGVRFIWS
ncbi:MAG: PilZ domain-containing protein [Deltaproteobacteria bacterium]|nr:MAG: PilZ domain-containing protein [Deltaproteobacteria bacterium]